MGDFLTYPMRNDGIRVIPPVSDDNLVDSLIQWEGFLPHPKDIGDGKITLGSGLTDPRWHRLYRERGDVWSKEDNRNAVAVEVAKRRKILEGLVPHWEEIEPETQKAFISYYYNYPFSRENSPKMFEAFDRRDFREAVNQMNATSKNPAFKKGLEIRREKERRWGHAGLNNTGNDTSEQSTIKSIFDQTANTVRSAIHQIVPHGASGRWSEGGSLGNPWDGLSLQEKAEMMKVAVRNGIYDLSTIRDKYNEFAKGGDISDRDYYTTMERVAEENNPIWNQQRIQEGIPPLTVDAEYLRILNDNTYNYRGYYNKYPQSQANADTHWTDEFKTVYHPTFSNESIYSGQKSDYNPFGLQGGHWEGDTFVPADWQSQNQYGKGGKIHIKPENRGKFTRLKERTGHSATWFKEHGTPAQRKMATFALNARHWKHGLGGPLVEAANIYDGTTENSQQMNIMAYHPAEDYYTGPSAVMPEINVTRKKDGKTYVGLGDFSDRYDRKKRPYFVSSRTGQLTAGDAMKGIDAATGPLLHWMQPSQYVGAFRDAANGKNPLTSMLRGNSGVVSEEYSQEHPWLSTAFNLGTDAAIYRAGAGIFNTFDKLSRYKRLEKNYTGVPHKQTKGTSVYMDESFPTVHNKHTVWTSDDPDYAGMFTLAEDGGKKTYGTVFDVYTDPKELSVLETPSVPEGQMVYWQGLPYKLKDGKVSYADNIDVRESIIPKTKEIAVNNKDKYGRYDFDDTGSYIWKDGEGSMPIADWNAVPGAIKTDHVVNYSRNNGFQATRFNRVYDGGVTLNDAGVFDYQLGNYYDYPINELVLNPGAPKYVLPHGTPKYKVLNQLPNSYSSNLLYNLLPLTIPTKLGHE